MANEPGDPLLSALEAVRDDLAERKVLDDAEKVDDAEKARKWRREIRRWLAPMCLALLLLLGGVAQGVFQRRLLVDRFDRAERNRVVARETVIGRIDEATAHIDALGACLVEGAADTQACIRAHLAVLPPTVGPEPTASWPPGPGVPLDPPTTTATTAAPARTEPTSTTEPCDPTEDHC